MKRFVLAFSMLLLTVSIVQLPVQNSAIAQNEPPAYAKWSRIAIKETISKYPDADVIDYLHMGRESQDDATIEKFKLWLKKDSQEFGVFVNVEFNLETEEVLHISFEETDR
ncbi:DUF3889 domain-containing protein [Virgibacillus ainsalahensis]